MSQTPTAPVAEKVDTTVGTTKGKFTIIFSLIFFFIGVIFSLFSSNTLFSHFSLDEPPTPTIPSEIKVPDGYKFSFLLYGNGNNKYTCVVASKSWDISSVQADLINRNDSHYDPAFYVASLTSNSDGTLIFKSVLVKHDNSSLTVKRDTKVDSPENNSVTKIHAPWERYAALNTVSGGSFSDIGYVVVVSTYKGASRAVSECGDNYQDGNIDTEPFTATYYFYSGSIPSNTTTNDSNESSNNNGAMNSIFIGYTQLGLTIIIGFITIGIALF
ncbi:10722_t:CDS:2 [Diversispora eburnea]|uniref:10722_t:CDS:1 n=1 Tax=Diversispora eburnea TaxID=1213867 RepID=A0A9N8UW10_9GLOM|nr:10722_t:CDS:2 [Diversispora eburnea]